MNFRFKIILGAIAAFLAPLAALFVLLTYFADVYIHGHALHSSVMVITALLSFYISWWSYQTYNVNKGDSISLFLFSLSFFAMGAVFVFHAIAISGAYLFNEAIFDIFEHYGLFFGAFILLGIILPYSLNTARVVYVNRKIFLYGLVALLILFFILVVFSAPVAEFLFTHINFAIGLTGVLFFMNAVFLLLSHDYNRKDDRVSFYLIIGFLILTGSGIVPFFYEEWNAVWWFSHIIFIVGFILALVELFRQKRTDVSFGEIFSNAPLSAKIILNYSLAVILGVFTLSYLNYYSAEKNLKNQLFHDLALTSRVERENILNFFEYAKGRAIDFSSDGFIRDAAKQIISERDAAAETVEKLNIHLVRNKMSLDRNIIGINVMDWDGKIIASTDAEEIGEDESDDDYFIGAAGLPYGAAYLGDIEIKHHFSGKDAIFTASTVLTDKETREPIGIIVNYYDAALVNDIVNGRYGEKITDWAGNDKDAKRTMEIFVANADGLMITESKFIKDAVLRQRVNTEAYWKCKTGENIRGVYDDYRGVKVAGASECLPNGWLLVTKIDAAEAFVLLKDIQKETVIFSIILLSLIVFIASLLAKAIIFPIRKLEEAAGKISRGDFSGRAEVVSKDEVGKLALVFNNMVSQLQQLYAGLEQKVKERTIELAQKVDEIKHEKDKFATVLYGIGDGVFVVDKDSKIMLWNKIAEEISGFSAREVLDKKYDQILKFTNEKTGEISDSFIKAAMETGQIQQMSNYTMLARKDGSQIAVADSCAPLKDKSGNVVGCVVIFRDATKEREIDRAKTEFVSLASHQLRTPLSAIKWYAEMLLGGDAGKLGKTQREYLASIDQSNERMIGLVNALLNVSRIDMGVFAIDPKPTNFAEVAQSVVDEITPQIKEKNIKFSAKYGKDFPMVQADPKLVRIIVQNLLSNAVKYTPTGGKVGIAINKDGENILIKVSDTGYGIPLEAQSKIFTKLFRADNARAKEVDGTGLGLYIVKSILNESGGKVWFESLENKGTTFCAAIPLAGMKKKEGNKELA